MEMGIFEVFSPCENKEMVYLRKSTGRLSYKLATKHM